MQCKVCQKVTMADGSVVWVCKECGADHLPGEGVVADVDTSMQADVNAAASQVPGVPSTSTPTPVAPPTTTPVDKTTK